jgi:hypothetical protein
MVLVAVMVVGGVGGGRLGERERLHGTAAALLIEKLFACACTGYDRVGSVER